MAMSGCGRACGLVTQIARTVFGRASSALFETFEGAEAGGESGELGLGEAGPRCFTKCFRTFSHQELSRIISDCFLVCISLDMFRACYCEFFSVCKNSIEPTCSRASFHCSVLFSLIPLYSAVCSRKQG